MTAEAPRSNRGAVIKWLVAAAIMVAMGVAFRGCLSVNNIMAGSYREHAEFQEAMRLVAKDSRVIAALGEPIRDDAIQGYHVFVSNTGSTTSYLLDISGPKAKGQISIRADNYGAIQIKELVFRDARGQLTNLLVSP